jgi:hypothetical protein
MDIVPHGLLLCMKPRVTLFMKETNDAWTFAKY